MKINLLRKNLCSRGFDFLDQNLEVNLIDSPKGLENFFFYDQNSVLRYSTGSGRDVFVDLLNGPPKPLLRKAVGSCKSVLDLTGGLCSDASFLWRSGLEVLVVEREPLFFEMIYSAFLKLEKKEGLELVFDEASNFLDRNPRQDAIYLDLFFEISSRTALPKKEMQFLQNFSCKEDEKNMQEKLIRKALDVSIQKVVLKTHKRADSLTDQKPTSCLKGKSLSYNVYSK